MHVLAALSFTIDELQEYNNQVDEHNKGPYFRSCSLGALQNGYNRWLLFEGNCAGLEVVGKFVQLPIAKMSIIF